MAGGSPLPLTAPLSGFVRIVGCHGTWPSGGNGTRAEQGFTLYAWLLPRHRAVAVVLCKSQMLVKSLTVAIATLAVLAGSATPSVAATRCGEASFYGSHGDGYAWRRTASGEIFDPGKMTTAHPSLPFGTRILVTNKSNGRSVTVRVTDRGPYAGGRILDLSSGAFARIAPHSSGVAQVCFTRL
jgi:rare lipoprotein A